MVAFGWRIVAVVFAAAGAAGCSVNSPVVPGGGGVSYGDPKAVEGVTNQFGSTDLQMLAESMARSLGQNATELRSRPFVTIADVRNKTSEYIDTRSITDSIRVQLLKSGTMQFVTDINGMAAQTDELSRQNNSGLYKTSTTAKLGNMQGAQFRIEGSISSIVKANASVKDVYYQFDLQMTDISSGTIVWADEKEIRKTSAR